MHVILGATGHIGSSLAGLLLDRNESVIVVSRDVQKAIPLAVRGATVAEVDVHDVDALRGVFSQAERAFVLNPPADPSTDTATEERRTVHSILRALEGTTLEKIVAESTYGAQPGDALGDLGVLYELEQGLEALPVPTSIIRGAYYMSNWDSALETAKTEGKVHTLFPVDFELPMVAPADIGVLAAHLLSEPPAGDEVHAIEGPRRYCANDVADAFSRALGRRVVAVSTPRSEWHGVLTGLGFSDKAARSFEAMTAATLEASFPDPTTVTKGPTTLDEYVRALVAA